ncbi:CHASE3 domain-containing protein [Mucilaginibacter sp. P19]|uniref:CHASE3 domain-containing protein n=1 Tax=Mucilaginibacter sp. P19 TaxID=3423947 RepID=UPI003D667745
MRLNFTRNLQLGYGFSILILLIVGLFSYATINNLLNSNKAVGHSTLVIQKLEQAISSMKDAETGQRGFLLTGKAIFLGPYKGAYLKTQSLISEVSALTAGNALQEANMAGIRVILTHRMAILEQLVSKNNINSLFPLPIWKKEDLPWMNYDMPLTMQKIPNANYWMNAGQFWSVIPLLLLQP